MCVLQLAKLLFDLLFTLFGWVTALFSLEGLKEGNGFWKGAISAVAAIFCIVYLCIHVREYYVQNRHIYKTKEKANKYLAEWIGTNTGHVLVYTNDMTWAGKGVLRDELLEKAKKGNLTLCLRKRSEEAEELIKAGAELFLLKGEGDLYARFIIVDYKSDNPKVSVYTTDSSRRYVNQQYDNENNPLVRRVFLDLAKFATIKNSPQKVDCSPAQSPRSVSCKRCCRRHCKKRCVKQ